jgi:hypothetical protein
MSTARIGSRLTSGILTALVAGATLSGPLTSHTAAQMPRSVRVVTKAAPIRVAARSSSDVLQTALRCSVFEVMDKEANYYWIYLPPDTYGVRRPGYVSALDVEITTDQPCKDLPTEIEEAALKQAEASANEQPGDAPAPAPSRKLIKAQNELEQARREYEKATGVPSAAVDPAQPTAAGSDAADGSQAAPAPPPSTSSR